MLRVGVLTNIPSPYQVELLNAIARRNAIDLRVWYCARQDTRRLWNPPTPAHWHRVGASWRIATRREQWYLDPRPAIELVQWQPDVAVFSVYPLPPVQLGMWWATMRRVPWIYWGEAVASGGSHPIRRIARDVALLPLKRWAAGFFAVGRKGVDNFRAIIGSRRPVLNVPYFSNLARFEPSPESSLRVNERRFLYVGSFTYRKGVDVLARAFSELVNRVPNVRLVVAGDGDTHSLFDKNLSLAASDRVARRGFVSWDALPHLYREGDFLVMPSRYDGWGLVIPEAMASGLPVIGSVNAGATLDLVRDNVTGWQLNGVEPDELAGIMGTAANLPVNEVLRMRRECLRRSRGYDAAVGARVFERAVRLILRQLVGHKQ